MPDPSTSPSILIIGAGIFGTSTAYHLALTHPCPSKITVIDRSPFPPHHASSTDINKIVRADYTSRFYMDLAYEALSAWKNWPILQDVNPNGKRYFHESGWIMLNNDGNDLPERIRRNFRERGSDVTEDVGIDERLREKWGGLLQDTKLEGMESGYWNPDAGWADAGDALAKMMEEAVRRGVKYETGEVEELVLSGDGVRGVRMKNACIVEADKILLATGAWTSQLLSPTEDELDIRDDDRVEKQVTAAGVAVVHYKLSDEEYRYFHDKPVLVYGDRGEMMPPPRGCKLLKFTNARSVTNTSTTRSGHQISVPPDGSQNLVPLRLQEETLESMVKNIIPQFASRPVDYWRLCWDAITPSQDQLMTKHPCARFSNLYLAVGGSFHSWKFLPTIGKYVVNVLNGESNGEEKDRKWAWKSGKSQERGAHEKVVPRRELRELEDQSGPQDAD